MRISPGKLAGASSPPRPCPGGSLGLCDSSGGAAPSPARPDWLRGDCGLPQHQERAVGSSCRQAGLRWCRASPLPHLGL